MYFSIVHLKNPRPGPYPPKEGRKSNSLRGGDTNSRGTATWISPPLFQGNAGQLSKLIFLFCTKLLPAAEPPPHPRLPPISREVLHTERRHNVQRRNTFMFKIRSFSFKGTGRQIVAKDIGSMLSAYLPAIPNSRQGGAVHPVPPEQYLGSNTTCFTGYNCRTCGPITLDRNLFLLCKMPVPFLPPSRSVESLPPLASTRPPAPRSDYHHHLTIIHSAARQQILTKHGIIWYIW